MLKSVATLKTWFLKSIFTVVSTNINHSWQQTTTKFRLILKCVHPPLVKLWDFTRIPTYSRHSMETITAFWLCHNLLESDAVLNVMKKESDWMADDDIYFEQRFCMLIKPQLSQTLSLQLVPFKWLCSLVSSPWSLCACVIASVMSALWCRGDLG